MCPPPPVAPGPFPQPADWQRRTGVHHAGECRSRSGRTPPLRVNSALVEVSPLLRLFFPLNPTGEAGNLVGRRPGVWGELGTLGLCDLDASHPTPELRCPDRVTSPSASGASRELWLARGSCPPLHPAGRLGPILSLAGGPASPSRPVERTCPRRTLSGTAPSPVCGVPAVSVFL